MGSVTKVASRQFKWVEITSQFSKDFIENNEDSDERYLLEVDVQNPEKLHDIHNDLLFLSESMKIEKSWKTCSQLAWSKRICHTHTKFQTSIKSRISIEISEQSH